jgi:DNA-binding NarL/FixJ family response regulator
MMKHCLIIEDIVETRRWLAEIVAAAFPACCIREAGTRRAALQMLETETFDLALIDLGLPDGSGLDVMQRLQRTAPQATCVVTTAMGDDAHIVAALSAGAWGYLLKEQPAELLSRQLRQLAAGVPALSPAIAKRIMEHFQRTGPAHLEDSTLSNREKETLSLISRGLRNSEVAAQLGIAESTVASHIKSIYRKLNITSRAEAAWHATRLGL